MFFPDMLLLSHLFQQLLEVAAHLVEKQIGALRIIDEQMEMVVVAADEKTAAAEGKVEPVLCHLPVDEIDHFRSRQEQYMVADGAPVGNPRQMGKTARAVERSFVDEFHGAHQNNGHR